MVRRLAALCRDRRLHDAARDLAAAVRTRRRVRRHGAENSGAVRPAAIRPGLFASMLAVLLRRARRSALRLRLGAACAQERLCRRGRPRRAQQQDRARRPFDDDDDDDEGILALGAITHWWLSARAFVRRAAARCGRKDEFGLADEAAQSGWRRAAERVEFAEVAEARVSANGRARVEPEFFAAMVSDRAASVDRPDRFRRRGLFGGWATSEARRRRSRISARRAAVRVEGPAPRPVPGARIQREAQTSLIGSAEFEMPTLHFLSRAEERRARLARCRRMRWSRMPGCSKACWRISASRARSSMSGPARSSRSTNSSRRRASNRRASSALPTTSPAR